MSRRRGVASSQSLIGRRSWSAASNTKDAPSRRPLVGPSDGSGFRLVLFVLTSFAPENPRRPRPTRRTRRLERHWSAPATALAFDWSFFSSLTPGNHHPTASHRQDAFAPENPRRPRPTRRTRRLERHWSARPRPNGETRQLERHWSRDQDHPPSRPKKKPTAVVGQRRPATRQ